MTSKGVAFVLARGGSKRLPGKNIKLLNGKPLIHYVLEAARASTSVDEVIVSSDSQEILELSEIISGVQGWKRPCHLSTDEATSIEVMKYLLQEYEDQNGRVDKVLLLQPTSPFTSSTLIDKAVNEFNLRKCHYLFTVVKSNIKAEWLGTIKDQQFKKFQVTVLNEMQYRPSGNIYIYSRDYLLDHDLFKNKLPDVLEVNEKEAVDIDTALDFQFAEFLLRYE